MAKEEAREYRKFRLRMKRFRRRGFPMFMTTGERVCASMRVMQDGKRVVKILPERKYLGKPVQHEESGNLTALLRANFREEDMEMAFEK